MTELFKKIRILLEKLSSKPQFDGLEISESSLTYVFMQADKPRTISLRIPPGVFKDGKFSDPNQFSEYLKKLHNLADPENPESALRVTLVLPAWMVFTQGFNVPNVGRDRLKEAVTLNLQMISPIPVAEANLSAQIIRETPDNLDFLGAFADKNAVGQLKDALVQNGFSPISFEFPALSLTRLIRNSVKLEQKFTMVFQISGEGLDIFILREGHLYFNYFRSWRSIQGNERTISRKVFDEVAMEEVKKVLDFSMSRFNEAPTNAIVMAPGFDSEISGILEKNFGIHAIPFVLNQTSPQFFVALGAAMRGRAGAEDGEFQAINLGGEGLEKAIYEEQILSFVSLWRNITVSIFVVLLVSLIFADSFLVSQSKGLAGRLALFSASGSQKEIVGLTAKASEFNGLVSTIKSIRGTVSPWHSYLNRLGVLADSNGIKIRSLDISSIGAPITLFGSASDYNAALKFKNIVSSDPDFTNVNLPITQITIASDNTASFSITFQFNITR